MKYLIDGVTKTVLALANKYQSLKVEDEYKVYDDTFSNIEGLDLVQINNFYINENGEKIENEQKDNDSRRMTITNDFDTALEWCDCYVCFRSIPFELTVIQDLDVAYANIDALLERIEKAKALNKKIYLGNRFSKEFEDIANTYENYISPHITKADLEEIQEYAHCFQGTYPCMNFMTSMIVGTNSASGKFTCALKVKKYYEEKGEKVVLIHTEESYPFLDDQNGTIIGFCRNFSDLTTDEDFIYFQSLVAKVYNEQRPDRIVFVTQSGFGIDGVIHSYQDANNGYKMKGLWDVFITRSFGLNEIIVSANCDKIELAKRIIDYFQTRNVGVITKLVYVNPIKLGLQDIIYTKEDKSEFYKCDTKCNSKELELALNGFALEYPDLEINCDYAGLSEKINQLKESNNFNVLCSSLYCAKILTGIKRKLSDTFTENIIANLNENYSSYNISDSDWEKIKKLALNDSN